VRRHRVQVPFLALGGTLLACVRKHGWRPGPRRGVKRFTSGRVFAGSFGFFRGIHARFEAQRRSLCREHLRALVGLVVVGRLCSSNLPLRLVCCPRRYAPHTPYPGQGMLLAQPAYWESARLRARPPRLERGTCRFEAQFALLKTSSAFENLIRPHRSHDRKGEGRTARSRAPAGRLVTRAGDWVERQAFAFARGCGRPS
jgi:hypothetical protein